MLASLKVYYADRYDNIRKYKTANSVEFINLNVSLRMHADGKENMHEILKSAERTWHPSACTWHRIFRLAQLGWCSKKHEQMSDSGTSPLYFPEHQRYLLPNLWDTIVSVDELSIPKGSIRLIARSTLMLIGICRVYRKKVGNYWTYGVFIG